MKILPVNLKKLKNKTVKNNLFNIIIDVIIGITVSIFMKKKYCIGKLSENLIYKSYSFGHEKH